MIGESYVTVNKPRELLFSRFFAENEYIKINLTL